MRALHPHIFTESFSFDFKLPSVGTYQASHHFIICSRELLVTGNVRCFIFYEQRVVGFGATLEDIWPEFPDDLLSQNLSEEN